MELLSLADQLPRRSVATGEVLIVDGEPAPGLFVLLEGALRISKSDVLVASVSDRGSCVGELALLLGGPATADVAASEPSVVAVIADASAMLDGDSGLPLALARLLARRLQVMTTYLVDLKQQYADHEGGLGMVDIVLDGLMRSSGPKSELGSDRDPDPEY